MIAQIDRLEAFAVRGEPAALEGIKQLQRASLPTRPLCLARTGRPDAFAVRVRSTHTLDECVTLSMMVFKKASKERWLPGRDWWL